ncbi:protein of unknown function [Dendrosporobacter quercicolus]|uniref:Protein-glutamine gamma-glutamyltransferase-like C-terminal domain-containing protein n=2 Tax=Dendrosporobacter quercicolus TaxID=146817 RepID=A0A1G9UQ23_9FIRM|nr:protein of unknown function [Dendrosporobacter quercicolus]
MSNEHARAVLEQILATPEFAIHNLGKRISAFLLENMALGGKGVHADDILVIGGIVAMIAGLALLIYLLRSIVPFWRVMVKEAECETAPSELLIRPSSAALLKQADENTSRGEFRSALREIYLAALIELNNRSLIVYQAAKTNSEYLREIRLHAADAAANFHILATLFEHKWYGLESCSGEDVNQGKTLYAALAKGEENG